MSKGFRIARIFGINIRLDWSWLLIFVLIVWKNLGVSPRFWGAGRRGPSLYNNEIVRNPWIWAAIVLCIALLIAAVYVPGLNTLLRVEDPGLTGWGLVIAASVLPWIFGQVYKSWREQ